jgi:drug/metabolite transporter (DMT)-like permease
MDGRSWLGLVLLGSVWGSSFFFFEIALETLGPLTVALGRVVVATLMLGVILAVIGTPVPLTVRFWGSIAMMGLLNNAIPFALIAQAQTEIDSGLAAILNATTPVFSVVVASLLVRQEVLTSNRVLGVTLGFAGVVTLIGPDTLSPVGVSPTAQALVLLGALSYASAGVFARAFLTKHPFLVSSFGQVTTAALWLLPLALVLERPWQASPTAETWGAVIAIGTLGTALAYPLYFLLLRRIGATNLMLVTLINPVVAVILGVFVLSESLAWTTFAGMALILVGLLAVDGRLVRRLRGTTDTSS